MDPRRLLTAARLRYLCASISLLLLCAPQSLAQPAPTSSELRKQALDLAYNLDHEQALVLLRRAIALEPDNPAPHRSLANVLWLNMLFRRGAVTVDHYLGSFSRADVTLAKPPPEIEAEFRTHVARSIALAERRVAANPKDAQAHYDLGAALGIQASYVATVEGRMLAGFKSARRSYDEHERVLELDPSRRDAGLVVGTYRYVVSTLSLPVRLMAYVAGFGGGREQGINLLRATAGEGAQDKNSQSAAAADNDARTDAMFALVLVYNRERRYDEALRVLQDLRRLYPRNRLLMLEAGATALRGGRAQQADDLLTGGLRLIPEDPRARIPGEETVWRYKRGAARAALGRIDAAVADLERATAPDAPPWVGGRARIEIGRLALKRGDRGAAAGAARDAESLCQRGNDPVCVGDARSILRSSNGR
jgi:tetratricopeptide (TPR) repeat protein